MPAAAVIPAQIVYINVVAVKKLVVESPAARPVWEICGYCKRFLLIEQTFTVNKIECLKQAFRLNNLAWNNKIRLLSFFWLLKGVMVNRNSCGYLYLIARGEILRLIKDKLKRRHLPRMFSLIKNES